MLLCLGAFVACNDEEPPKEPIISSGYWDINELPDSSVPLDGITSEWFNSYTTVFGGNIQKTYENINNDRINFMGIPYYLKIITTYEEFLEGVVNNNILNTVTEHTFEDNYVVIVQSSWGASRDRNMMCYNDLKKEDGYYSLSYNRIIHRELMEDCLEDPYVDIIIIPKELFKDHPNTIEIKLLYKEYVFDTAEDIYNSSCYEYTYLPE